MNTLNSLSKKSSAKHSRFVKQTKRVFGIRLQPLPVSVVTDDFAGNRDFEGRLSPWRRIAKLSLCRCSP